jgi:hypothetical protein
VHPGTTGARCPEKSVASALACPREAYRTDRRARRRRYAAGVPSLAELIEREEARYREGLERLPAEPDARQKQLTRVANAALGAGLARLLAGEPGAETWLLRAAERYRESHADAPPESWGRMLGAVKMRLLSGDAEGARRDARWTLDEGAAGSASPIGRYAAALACLVLGDDPEAARLAAVLQREESGAFPRPVADALRGLATGDGALYAAGLAATLRSFETREAYLEDVPIADTVLVLERLAEPRGLAQRPASPLLP